MIKMYTLTILMYVLCVIYTAITTPTDCNACMIIYQCEEAVTLLKNVQSNETFQRIREAFCGFSKYFGKNVPKICCNHFQAVKDEDDLADHPNYNLLPTSCGEYNGFRIISGQEASLYEFPWMVLISCRSDGALSFECAGSLINSRYVLTAAHCIVNKVVAGVRIGEFDIDTKEDCQNNVCESYILDVRVKDIIYHERYVGEPKFLYDIGLIRLARPVNFSHKNVGVICLPKTKEQRDSSITHEMATVAGWGLTEYYTNSRVLLKVNIPIHNHSECLNFYSRLLSDDDPDAEFSYFCAGSENKDSCKGDSGGPLIIPDLKTFQYIQYGIVSQGTIRCGRNSPGVYTDVRKYMKWILDHIKP